MNPIYDMTLRDQFACAALTGLIGLLIKGDTALQTASAAYNIADAMLKAREVQP